MAYQSREHSQPTTHPSMEIEVVDDDLSEMKQPVIETHEKEKTPSTAHARSTLFFKRQDEEKSTGKEKEQDKTHKNDPKFTQR